MAESKKKAPVAYRLVLDLVGKEELPETQKKLNQWITTGLLIKFETMPVGQDKILFKILVKKKEA